MNYIITYWQEIQKDEVIVGKWIRLLYDRLVKGIDDGTYIYDVKKAKRAINFIETFVRHNKGPLGGQKLKLQLWQKALIASIFGLIDPETGYRAFVEVPIIIGRKMGKSLLAAGIMAYEAYVDGDFGSEIYCMAPKLDQSDLVYSAFRYTVDHEPAFASITKPRKNDLYIADNNTSIKKIAFNEKKSDGYNPQLVIADEISSWPGARGLKQYEVMRSGSGARNEPLFISISSAGYENNGIYDELYTRGTAWLQGNSKETRLLPVFYTIDDIGKWDDINELYKSLPGLGVSVPIRFVMDEIKTAYQSLSKKGEFITKYCNLKQTATNAWLSADLIEGACCDHIDLSDIADKYAIAGLDLSQTTDLTSACVVCEIDGLLHIVSHFWLPGAKLEEAIARDGLPYDLYIQRGFLSLSGDNIIDYHDVHQWFVNLMKEYRIYTLVIGYDRYSAAYLVQDLQSTGYKCDDVFQGDNLWGVMQEFEALLRDKKIRIGDNDLLKAHMFDSGVFMSRQRGRGRLVKTDNKKHIDGMAAVLDAMTVRQKWYADYGDRLQNK